VSFGFMKIFLILFTCSFVFTGAAMFRLLHKGAPIEPTRALDPTVFSAPEQIGAAMFRRFYPELNESQVVILASSPALKDYDRIWQGLLALAREKKWPSREIFSQDGLRPIGDATAAKTFADSRSFLRRLKNGQRSIVQISASPADLKDLRHEFPQAMILVQDRYPARFKKLDHTKLTAAAEVDMSKIAYLYVSEPTP